MTSERRECERCEDPGVYTVGLHWLCDYHAREAERRESEMEEWESCDACGGDGVMGHDCGEDTCCCRHPIENVKCQTCDGAGGWER